MNTPAPEGPERGAAGRRLTLGRGSLIAAALLAIAIAATTTYRSESEAGAGGKPGFDPAAYAARTYGPKVVPAIRKNAVDITTLHEAMADGMEAAGKRHGHRAGTGPYSYAVTLTGTAGPARGGLMEVTVPGLADARVSVQVGPALNGTALRDAVGFIEFGQFVNQVDYADAATALNAEVKATVLKKFDAAAAEGEQVEVTGAMTPLTADVLTVTPISIESTS
jgi:predicted lipoprotein